jgi:hypothetical protein
MTPFLTFLTPTFQRPKGLAACMASVAEQTESSAIEHLILADYVGAGVGAMFARLPDYVDAVHGAYVHVLSDDEVLTGPTVVAELRRFAAAHDYPAAICVRGEYAQFGLLPNDSINPPVLGHIGLGCLVTRVDVWRSITRAGGWGHRYEGDYDFARAVYDFGHRWQLCDVVLMSGCCHRGQPEAAYAC